jgi:signal transduction histidine kinase
MTFGRLNTIAARLAAIITLAIIFSVPFAVFVGCSIIYLPTLLSERSDQRPRIINSAWSIYVLDVRHEKEFSFNFGSIPNKLVSKLTTTISLIAATPANDRATVAAAASQPNLQLAIEDSPLALLREGEGTDLNVLRQLMEFELGARSQSLIVGTSTSISPNTGALVVEAELPDKRWLLMVVPHYEPPIIPYVHLAWVFGSASIFGGFVSVIAARLFARPISAFARAAERFGVDSTAAPIAETGPYELRIAIRAFNRMQERLKRYVDDRTQMLAAMSHDLRTPLNRLRLRAEFIEDHEQQRKLFGDLEAMNLMIDQTLAFARDDAKQEPRRLVELGVLVEDVCEDATDVGASVSYTGARGVNVCCRPTAISRAVANLVDNAVKYSGAAEVRLVRGPDRIVILIEDHGPGIPPDECEKVFAPFYRLERSRNSGTGGTGLGLSIARTIAREHGGDVTLATRENHGLCARLELPA